MKTERVTQSYFMNIRTRRAFTLIELLIVVAVIGVLAALLMPALSKSISKGRQTKCANNLRQIYLASELYSNDNDGIIVHNLNNIPPSNVTWVEAITPYVEKTVTSAGSLRHTGVWACPVSKAKASGGEYSDFGKNFFVNGDLKDGGGSSWGPPPNNGPHTRNFRKIALTQPSRTMAFADGANRDLQVWNANFGLAYRHDGRANIVFFDGHAEMFLQKDMISDMYKSPWSAVPQ